MSFAKYIKKVRFLNLMTQEDFARELNVSFATVNRWETGKSKPNMRAMKAIDEFCKNRSIDFNVSLEVLEG